MEEHILQWLERLGIPGLVIGGVVYIIALYIKQKPVEDNVLGEIIQNQQKQTQDLIDKLTVSINQNISTNTELKMFMDTLIEKNLIDRVHKTENAISNNCYRLRQLEDLALGLNVQIKQGKSNYDGYIKGRESGRN